MSWREFDDLIAGLLSADSRLARHLRALYKPEPKPDGGSDV